MLPPVSATGLVYLLVVLAVIKHLIFYFYLEASERSPLLSALSVSLLDWSPYSKIRGFINEYRAGFTRRGAKLVGKLLRGQ